jgi:hypothetical protein
MAIVLPRLMKRNIGPGEAQRHIESSEYSWRRGDELVLRVQETGKSVSAIIREMDETRHSPSMIRAWYTTARAFPREDRNPDVPFTHHMTVAQVGRRNLPDCSADELRSARKLAVSVIAKNGDRVNHLNNGDARQLVLKCLRKVRRSTKTDDRTPTTRKEKG